jgi:hypothetical protein
MSTIKSIVTIIFFYLFINLVLWIPQKLYHWKDLNRIEEIEIILSEIEVPAEECKNKLFKLKEVVDNKSLEIDKLKRFIDSFSGEESDLIYNLNIKKYNQLLEEYNILAVEFNAEREECLPTFEKYDNLVLEGNDLIDKTGMFMLIPMPRGSTKRVTNTR